MAQVVAVAQDGLVAELAAAIGGPNVGAVVDRDHPDRVDRLPREEGHGRIVDRRPVPLRAGDGVVDHVHVAALGLDRAVGEPDPGADDVTLVGGRHADLVPALGQRLLVITGE